MSHIYQTIQKKFLPSYINLMYRHEYFTTIMATNQNFDAMKFKRIKDELIKQRLIKKKDIIKSPRVSDDDIALVHDKKYIQMLKNPVEIGRILGLDYVNEWDDYLFEHFRYIVGGTVQGLYLSINEHKPTFNFGGGYHHAHKNRAEGYCVLNDVAIAIEKYRKDHTAEKKFLIIDLDYHQGNGNLEYFQSDDNVFTFSIHDEKWLDLESKYNLDIELPSDTEDEYYLKTLQNYLPAILDEFKPDSIIYIAGSDVYINDALGGFRLSEKGILERDIYVYKEINKRKLPILVLAAGGYGPDSWIIYFNFIKWTILNRNIRLKYFPLPSDTIL